MAIYSGQGRGHDSDISSGAGLQPSHTVGLTLIIIPRSMGIVAASSPSQAAVLDEAFDQLGDARNCVELIEMGRRLREPIAPAT